MPTEAATHMTVQRVPEKQWMRIWLAALLLTVAIVGSAEAFWRSQGHRPSVSDSPDLWAYHRNRVYNERNSVVLIGASRIQSAFSPSTFRDNFPEYELVQLAEYAGGSPIGTLLQLADDKDFKGIVICDLIAAFLFQKRWNDQRHLYQHRASITTFIDQIPIWWLQDQLNVVSPQIRLMKIPKAGKFPEPKKVRLCFDRSIKLDFRVVKNLDLQRKNNTELFRGKYLAELQNNPDELFADGFEKIENAVRIIHDRGGQVVFFRCPSSGDRRQFEEQFHPREEFWDRFAAYTRAHCIHFDDIPKMQSLKLPDNSHLDYRDSDKFTLALLDELLRRRILH